MTNTVRVKHSRYSVLAIVKHEGYWHVLLYDNEKDINIELRVLFYDFVEWLAEKLFSAFGKIGLVKAESYIYSEPENTNDYITEFVFSKL